MAEGSAAKATLSIDPNVKLSHVPDDFMGLSYESGQLAYPDFFSDDNTSLVDLFARLSPAGVLRLGGNLSEFTVWSDEDPVTPPQTGGLVGPDPGVRVPRTFTITPKAIRNLKTFLKATGWTCIYGLNLGGGTVEQALAEGGYVAKTLGPLLQYVQFGNEPDLFKHHDEGDKRWTFEEYLAKWKTFRAAFHEKLPGVAVAGPDTAFNQAWVTSFCEAAPKEVVAVTSHYYAEGPPTDPKMTIDFLLHPGKMFESSCRKAMETAKAAGLPFRMAEGNSCFNAGKPGVSDTFASALWAGDYCLQMASLGCVGVNLHSGANGPYSPIVGSALTGISVRPEFYGLMVAQEFAGHTMRATKLDAGDANVTAYAARVEEEKNLVAIFNKDARDVEVSITVTAGNFKSGDLQRLVGPSIDSKGGITYGGAGVGHEGEFRPKEFETVRMHHGEMVVRMPGYSAAVIRQS